MGWNSAYGEMHSLDGDIEDVTTTFLLIVSEGAFSVEPFQLKDQVHGRGGIYLHYDLPFFTLYE